MYARRQPKSGQAQIRCVVAALRSVGTPRPPDESLWRAGYVREATRQSDLSDCSVHLIDLIPAISVSRYHIDLLHITQSPWIGSDGIQTRHFAWQKAGRALTSFYVELREGFMQFPVLAPP